MKNMEKKDIQLQDIDTLKKTLFELKMSFWLGKSNLNTSMFKKIKKDIARAKTLAWSKAK